MTSGKYSLITDDEIKKGLAEGVFKKDSVNIIRNSDGEIVKHLKLPDESRSTAPQTMLQINNTVIYQANVNEIINSILEIQNKSLFDDLKIKYSQLLGKLRSYKTYESDLDDLNINSLELLIEFNSRIDQYVENFPHSKLNENHLPFVEMINSQVNILLIRIISCFWRHNIKIAKDVDVNNNIENFYNTLRKLFEQLLAKSTIKNEVNFININDGGYSQYFFEKNNFSFIEKLLKHDSRFNSLANFMDFIVRCNVKNNYIQFSCFENKERDELIKSILKVLDDILKVKDILNELSRFGCQIEKDINSGNELGVDVNNLLALHPSKGFTS